MGFPGFQQPGNFGFGLGGRSFNNGFGQGFVPPWFNPATVNQTTGPFFTNLSRYTDPQFAFMPAANSMLFHPTINWIAGFGPNIHTGPFTPNLGLSRSLLGFPLFGGGGGGGGGFFA